MTTALDQLRAFANDVLEMLAHDPDIEDMAINHGLLTCAIRHAPCGPCCDCVVDLDADDWTRGIECPQPTALLTGADDSEKAPTLHSESRGPAADVPQPAAAGPNEIPPAVLIHELHALGDYAFKTKGFSRFVDVMYSAADRIEETL